MKYIIGNTGEIELNTIVLDLNGTLAVKGKIVDGVEKRIHALKKLGYKVLLFTGDQRGNAAQVATKLGIEVKVAKNGMEKGKLMKDLNKENTVAIGNARIDIDTFCNSKVAIATLQSEGIHLGILQYVQVIVPSVVDALDLLIDPNSFAATFRT